MKTLFILLTSLTALSAQAVMTCVDDRDIVDAGYVLRFNADLSKVDLYAQSIRGPIKRGEARCVPAGEQAQYPDAIYTVVTCEQPPLADWGFRVVVRTGGIAGRTTASLSSLSMNGERPMTTLHCSGY